MTREDASYRIRVLRRKVKEPTDTQLGWLETWIYKEDVEALRMSLEALEQEPYDEYGNYRYPSDIELPEPNTATSMPCGDAISFEAVKNTMFMVQRTAFISDNEFHRTMDLLMRLPSVNPQEPKAEQFAEWVAREIFDENWEYNKDAFAEIACRKLAKLGIVREKGDEWELVEPQEGEDE